MDYSKVSEDRAKLKFEDTNMANFGSDLEYKVKKNASEKELAWNGTRKRLGLTIWRVEKFQIKDWPQEKYGSFYDGDTYIILSTTKPKDTLIFKAYLWIGEYSSQDEYGTGAYKIVELDDYLDRMAQLNRETQLHESNEFIKLFPDNKINYLNGGIETGFTHVEKPTEYPGRLFHVRRNDQVYRINQVPMNNTSINNGDCFILDKCLDIYDFRGDHCSMYEKFKAATLIKTIRDERSTIKAKVHEVTGLGDLEDENVKKFWELLGGIPKTLSDNDVKVEDKNFVKKMINCNDDSGEIQITTVCEGKLEKDKLKSDDVFLVDTESTLYVWIGNESSKNEKLKAFGVACNYLQKSGRPSWITITILKEGHLQDSFESAFC